MAEKLKILEGGAQEKDPAGRKPVKPEVMLRHFRNVNASMLQDALDTWGEVWDQLQGSLTHGVMIVPEVQKNFEPECGWSEFCEKLWILRRHIDHAKRISEGRV